MGKPAESPLEAFIARLGRLARKQRGIEALVFWGGPQGWNASPFEVLESEEIAFYAEGLLLDGFHMRWTLVAAADTASFVDHLRLAFWQDDSPPPALPPRWIALEEETWTAA